MDIAEFRSYMVSAFGWRIRKLRLDFDEVFGEILKGLAVRARGAGAWNPDKSQWSTYVYMVASCVISNEAKKASKKVRPVSSQKVGTVIEGYDLLVQDLKRRVPESDHVILDHMLTGDHSVSSLCKASGRGRGEVERAMKGIRAITLELSES